jgi:chromosome segregation ATPase
MTCNGLIVHALLPHLHAWQVTSSAEQLAQLQQLLQTREQALSVETSQHQTTRAILLQLQARFDVTASELCSSKVECSKLEAALTASSSECQELQSLLLQKEQALAALNVELDNKQDDLDDVKFRGSELLTYQGEWQLQAQLKATAEFI